MKKPQITEAQRIAERIGADSVVILAFGEDMVAGASYGATKAKCAITGRWMDKLIDTMAAGKMSPPIMDGRPDLAALASETLVEKNRRLRQAKCKHEGFFMGACLDCGAWVP